MSYQLLTLSCLSRSETGVTEWNPLKRHVRKFRGNFEGENGPLFPRGYIFFMLSTIYTLLVDAVVPVRSYYLY